jgi:hypothetical protein
MLLSDLRGAVGSGFEPTTPHLFESAVSAVLSHSKHVLKEISP